jgi:molybdenum cofactor cytidylyltransferase
VVILPTVLVLASGQGKRFLASGGQQHKLHSQLGDKSVLDWTLAAVRDSGLPFHLESAPHPGMGDSIAAAVRHTAHANGWLILPGDLPLVQAATLRALALAMQEHAIVHPVFAGQRGHPVGFSADYFPQLSNLHGEHGAARLLAAAYALDVTDQGCVLDVDTVQDLARVKEYVQQLAG